MTNDQITAAVRAGTMTYADGVAAAAANAGMSQFDFASDSSGYRVITNLASAATGAAPYFIDTTTPITPFGGYTGPDSSHLVAPSGPVSYQQDMVNPVYGGQVSKVNAPSNGRVLTAAELAPPASIAGSNQPGVARPAVAVDPMPRLIRTSPSVQLGALLHSPLIVAALVVAAVLVLRK